MGRQWNKRKPVAIIPCQPGVEGEGRRKKELKDGLWGVKATLIPYDEVVDILRAIFEHWNRERKATIQEVFSNKPSKSSITISMETNQIAFPSQETIGEF